MTSPARISESDRIPLVQKLSFAAGVNMDYVATGLMTGTLWMPFFNIGLEMPAVVLGLILMVLRAWDALTDPIMGNLSDNARTRWGRRRPFMFVAAITTACLYPIMWHFPESVRDGTSWLVHVADWIPFIAKLELAAPEKAASIYLILVGMIFFASFTVWSMPYYGMQLELTPNYDERTRLTAWMTLFGKISSLAGSWLLLFVIFVGMLALGDPKALEGKPAFLQKLLSGIQPWLTSFTNPHPGEKPIVVGMRLVCWLIALGIVCFGLLPALFVKERYYKAEASKQASEPFWKSIGESIRCTPLWALISISFFLVLGSSSVGSLGQYVNFYYVCHGDLAKGAMIAGMKGSVIVVAGIASIPLFTWLGEKFDKRTMVMTMLASSMTGHLLNWFLMTPAHPYWQIIPGVFESSAIAAVWLFLPSMKADVADWDEIHTTRRREGAINAFYSWFIKASLTASMGIGGVVLQISGFNPKIGDQPQEVVNRMFFLYLTLPLIIWSVAMLSAWFYPLGRARSAQIRAELEARRGAL
ncbi:sodium:melibiose symporter [Opitutaceae bacterium TAV5]|nr:sodium:melibiose symporter [Opitutaceae bacterium TAV5]